MGILYVVSTPIGNLEDITYRGVHTLESVAVVYAEDTRRTQVLLNRYGITTPLKSAHAHNEARRARDVLDRLEAGEDVALVSDAGTPLVSDPGARMVQSVQAAGFAVVPIPGASAVLAALVGSGLPAVPFTFYGFPEKRGSRRRALLQRVADTPGTSVLFEAPGRLDRLLQELRACCGPEREVAVGREMTKVHEEFFRGTLAEACVYYQGRAIRGEVTVVVGPPSASEAPDDEDVARVAAALLAEGRSPKEAAREVAERLGVSRNRAYRTVLSVVEGS